MDKCNPDYIKHLLLTSDYAVERAMRAIFLRQTEEEKHGNLTKESNGKGFSAFDAPTGSYYAKWVMSNRRLTGRHLVKARIMSFKYVRQLCEIAKEKMAKAESINPDMG
jgi:hypothetical protein